MELPVNIDWHAVMKLPVNILRLACYNGFDMSTKSMHTFGHRLGSFCSYKRLLYRIELPITQETYFKERKV
jgi:hypothetical protein